MRETGLPRTAVVPDADGTRTRHGHNLVGTRMVLRPNYLASINWTGWESRYAAGLGRDSDRTRMGLVRDMYGTTRIHIDNRIGRESGGSRVLVSLCRQVSAGPHMFTLESGGRRNQNFDDARNYEKSQPVYTSLLNLLYTYFVTHAYV